MYESISEGTLQQAAQTVRAAIAHDFDLFNCALYQDDQECLADVPRKVPDSKREHWTAKLLRKGVPEEDVSFVFTILNPDPRERWTAEDIIRSGFLDSGS